MGCSWFRQKPIAQTCARDYCLLANLIVTTPEDKQKLKDSQLSKAYIQQLKDHNDLWRATCITPTESE